MINLTSLHDVLLVCCVPRRCTYLISICVETGTLVDAMTLVSAFACDLQTFSISRLSSFQPPSAHDRSGSFFGLYFCKEPTPGQLADVAAARASSVAGVHVNTTGKGKRKSSKPKPVPRQGENDKGDPAILPVIRSRVDVQLFLSARELPKLVEFDHILGMTLAYLMSYCAEELFLCYFPDSTVVASQIQWFAALILCMSLWELAFMSISMSSIVVFAGIGLVAAVFALAAIANGDSAYFFLLDSAFADLKAWSEFMLVERFSVGEQNATRHASRMALVARICTSLLAGILTACLAVPARRFARYDYDIYQRYRRDDGEEADDPYSLQKPTHWLILAIAVDHFLPISALCSFIAAGPRGSELAYHPGSLALMIAVVVLRLALGRVRLQMYLDGAVNAFREFSSDKSGGILEAGQRVRVRTMSTSFYLPTVGCMYICGPILSLMLTLTAKRSGNMSFGACRLPSAVPPVNLLQTAREVVGFLAWIAVFAHSTFSLLSLGLDAFLDYVDPQTKKSDITPGRIVNASTRRRLRRMQNQDG
jgi:Predicted transmembrane protein 161AB